MEVYAGFQENADWNVGRLLDAIEEMGDLDNTLVFYIWGDNGASMEGTLTGSFNEMTFLNGVVLDAEQQLELIEQYGGIEAHRWRAHRAARRRGVGARHEHPVPVGQADGQPPRRHPRPDGRRLAQADQPRRRRCAPSSPTASTSARRSWRSSGIPEPKSVDGIAQEPMDGTSFAYTFDDPEAPERHTVQYFEMFGSRAIYKDGWWACSRLDKAPWDFSPADPGAASAPGPDGTRTGRRGSSTTCPTTSPRRTNIAADHPEKLKELQDLWWQEAERNRVLPLLGGLGDVLRDPAAAAHDHPVRLRRRRAERPARAWSRGSMGRSYAIEADLHVPDGGAEGVIVANADFIGGFGLWVDQAGILHHTYSFLGVETYRQVATEQLPTGDVSVRMLFEADEPNPVPAAR